MKTLVINTIGAVTKGFVVPASAENAKSFCDALLVGQYEGYEKTSELGTDSGILTYNKVKVQIKGAGGSTYFSFAGKATASDVDIQNALVGKTFNGIKADTVFVQMNTVTVGA